MKEEYGSINQFMIKGLNISMQQKRILTKSTGVDNGREEENNCYVWGFPDRLFPNGKLKDIDAQFINSGVAGDTIAEMGARLAYDVFPYKPDIIIMQGGANDFLMSLYPGARVLAERLIRLARRIRQQLPDTKIYIESMYPAYTKRKLD